jgi:hypothetical protein
MLILSYYWHDRGACYALMLAEGIILAISYLYVKKCFPDLKIFDPGTFLQSMLASLLFIPVIWLLKTYITSPVLIIVIALLICVPVYFLFQLLVAKNKLVDNLYGSALASLKKVFVH